MTISERQPVSRVLHDRPTLISYASVATWSWFVYGFGASLALLRDDQGSAAWLSGLHVTSLAVGGVVGALITPWLNARFGRGLVMRIGVIGAALSILLFLAPGASVGVTLTAVFVTCVFGNIIVVCVTAFIAVHQADASAPAFTESTGLMAFMGLIAPLAVGAATLTIFGWRAGVLVAVIAFAAIEIWRGRQLPAFGGAGQVVTREEGGPIPSTTYWALVAAMLYVGAEFCMSLWGVELLRERAGMSPGAAAAGLSTVAGGLFVGRAFGLGLARRFPSEMLLRASLCAGLVAFTIAWMGSSAAIMLPFLFLTGVALSLTWPMCLARIIRSAHGRADRASSLAMVYMTTAIGAGPFILGALAESMPVHQAFLIVPVLIVFSLVLVIFRPVPDAITQHSEVSPAQ